MKKFLNNYAYLIVAIFLIFVEICFVLKDTGGDTDFWEHSAVVNELSKNLLHPTNPIINSSISHAFFSPYSLIVASFSRITNLSSIQSLQIFAIFNLVFFLLSFYLFCKAIFKENFNLIAVISLFFILCFYGKSPFFWSGFYHLKVLHFNLSYPSTFAIALSFLILTLLKKVQGHKNIYILIIFLNGIVFITHPTTAIFLFIAIFALNVFYDNYNLKQYILRSIFLIVPSLIICLLWPYYSIINLYIGNTIDFHSQSQILYTGVLSRFWPVLLIIPGIVFIKKDNIIKFFLIAIFLMILIFIGGYITKLYGFGRIISNVVLFSHILIAYLIILMFKDSKVYSKLYILIFSISLLVSLYLNRSFFGMFRYYFKNTDIESAIMNNKYSFLKTHVSSNELILSDPESSWYIPSFSGKVISSIHPLYWVKDIEDRRKAVDSFFDIEKSDSVRHSILDKYNPNYILIDYSKVQLDKHTIQWLDSIGATIYEKDKIKFIKIY